nr:hypothetical protein [uncultured Romboutsia sp.]
MKKTHISLFLVCFMIFLTGCNISYESNESEIKTLTEYEYEELKEKPLNELSEKEQIQISNYEELILSRSNNKLPEEYVNYVEEHYSKKDTDIKDTNMFTNENISIAFFYNSNSIGIYGNKSQKGKVKNEIERVLSYYDCYVDSDYVETFVDQLAENKDEYIYKTYGEIEVRGLYSKDGYDIHITNK